MFKESFKYYKSRKPPPDLSEVLDFNKDNINLIRIAAIDNKEITPVGLRPPSEWMVYRIKDKNGLVFVKNPFTHLGQRYWIARCVRDYTRKPQKLNIDAHNLLNEKEHWWDVCQDLEHVEKDSLSKKLRWATLGYHHNWNTKVYSESNQNEFPADLQYISGFVARSLGFNDFKAEAAIVNFYHLDSTLSGHTDHSEENLDAPLLSFSFGHSAIFLIGGVSESDPAFPLFIHSGDIVIMSKESRLCYHAVPKILPAEFEFWNEIDNLTELTTNNLYENCKKDYFWENFNKYIKQSRINVNVRQVLREGQNKLNR